MSIAPADSIVNAVLYEGYMLYPYRASSVKNRQRWTFGGVYPHAYSISRDGAEPWMIQTQFLLQGGPDTLVTASPGFLHVVEREAGELPMQLRQRQGLSYEPFPQNLPYRTVEVLTIDGQSFYTWQEALEQKITVEPMRIAGECGLGAGERTTAFSLSGHRELEPLCDKNGMVTGVLARTRKSIEGTVSMRTEKVAEEMYRVTVKLMNCTPCRDAQSLTRDAATLQALVSCHLILRVTDGRLLSSIDPPAELAAAAAECENVGVWPVLIGEEGACDTMLASPIILYDYPQVAPESPGDLFDGTEIDEILTLRILTMTDQEKREMAAVDERSRALLERTEKLTSQQLQQLHGALRGIDGVDTMAPNGGSAGSPWEALDSKPRLAFLRVSGVDLRIGDKVRLHPKGNANIFDLALAGKIATIESLERDFEDRVHIAVTVDDDPGRDLGLARMPGHRFFFGPDEVEPITSQETPS